MTWHYAGSAPTRKPLRRRSPHALLADPPPTPPPSLPYCSEILEGEVVIANTEAGYWTTKAARNYANPLLVKLTRALWAIDPDFTVIGDSSWGRAGALQRSGVVPRSLDIVSAMAATIGRFVDKNGLITPFTMPGHVQPVHLLRALVAGEAAGSVPPQAAPNFVHTHLA